MSTLDDRIAQFRERLGVRSDRKLAEKLGITVAAISGWRRRGVIPNGIDNAVQALADRRKSARLFADRMAGFDVEILGKGKCLAIFLAPSVDALRTKRFPATIDYGALLDSYAASFNFISVACAEEVEARMSELGANAAIALASLTQEDERALYGRIMDRANWWKHADASSIGSETSAATTLHDRQQGFRSGEAIDDD